MKTKPDNLRLFYAAGPGDVIGTYRHWCAGQDDPSQVSLTYSGQFFDVCRELGAQGYVIASHPRRERVTDEQFVIEHRPRPWPHARSVFYHLAMLAYGLQIIVVALRFRAHAAIISEGTTHWFVLSLLAWCGVPVVPALHCTLWRKFVPLNRQQRVFNWLNRRFFRRDAAALLSASREIERQIATVTGGDMPALIEFMPSYRPATFAAIGAPSLSRTPFRVLFAGRIERDKGVFDLLAASQQLRQQLGQQFAQGGFTFDICGTGSALDELRVATEATGLAAQFQIHGYCQRPQMQQMLSAAHALIVPTTADFIEGFNQVVVEGVLAGRPVITSTVCPALEYVRDAVLQVEPGDVAGYAAAITRLRLDEMLYAQMRAAGAQYQEQFYDTKRSWAAALKRALRQSELGGTESSSDRVPHHQHNPAREAAHH